MLCYVMLCYVMLCYVMSCVYSDHDFVFLELNLHTVNRYGLGTWKFNNSLLRGKFFGLSHSCGVAILYCPVLSCSALF